MKALIFVALFVSPALSMGSMPGGYETVDTSREDVQKAATFAVQQLNARANSLYADMLLTVVKAQTQVSR